MVRHPDFRPEALRAFPNAVDDSPRVRALSMSRKAPTGAFPLIKHKRIEADLACGAMLDLGDRNGTFEPLWRCANYRFDGPITGQRDALRQIEEEGADPMKDRFAAINLDPHHRMWTMAYNNICTGVDQIVEERLLEVCGIQIVVMPLADSRAWIEKATTWALDRRR